MPINNIAQTISTIPPAGARGVDVQSLFVTKQEDFQDHLQGTTVVELNALVTQQNTMAGEMNSTATQVNTNANTATTQAGIATTKAGEANTSASQALTSRNQAETFAQQAQASAESVDANNIVYITTNQTIAGVKTFSSNPISTDTQSTATNALTRRDFVTGLDSANVKLTGNQTKTGNLTLHGVLNGTAVTQSATDTTVGRLLKVGDFGLGVSDTLPGFVGDLNSLKTTGRYLVQSSSSNNLPPLAGAYLVDVKHANQGIRFIQQAEFQDGGEAIYIFSRKFTASGWTPWREIYHTGNVVGTVSQSGGVPTGAIIERGSNANGEFVKFADGTLICTSKNSFVLTGNDTLQISSTFLFPYSFSSPRVSASICFTDQDSDDAHRNMHKIICRFDGGVNGTRTGWVISSMSNVSGTIFFELMAIGRWY